MTKREASLSVVMPALNEEPSPFGTHLHGQSPISQQLVEVQARVEFLSTRLRVCMEPSAHGDHRIELLVDDRVQRGLPVVGHFSTRALDPHYSTNSGVTRSGIAPA